MKKILAVLLVLTTVLAFSACAKKVEPEAPVTPEEPETQEEQEPKEPEEEPVPEEAPVPESIGLYMPDGYQKLYEKNGVLISYNPVPEVSETGDMKIWIYADAENATESYTVMLSDCSVNGLNVFAPSQIDIVAGGNGIEMPLSIWTSSLSAYGITAFGSVSAGFTVFGFDPERRETVYPAIAVIEPVELISGTNYDMEIVLPAEPIYNSEGVKVYSVQSEEELNSNLNLYIVNETGNKLTLLPTDLEMNGEKQDVDYSSYALTVNANATVFGIIPLPNYTFDEKTWEAKKFEVTSYALNFDTIVQ